MFHVIATAFQNAPYTTQLVLCFAGLCVHCKQGILCYSQSLPKSNIHFLAHVAFCKTVRALQANSCMLRAQPSRVQCILPSFCCVLQGVCIPEFSRNLCPIYCTQRRTKPVFQTIVVFFCSCLVIFSALLRVMCMFLLHCSSRVAAFCRRRAAQWTLAALPRFARYG